MPLPKFEYLTPKTLDEACSLLAKYKGARPLAGGTDILVKMKDRVVSPPYLVGLKNITGLDQISYDKAEGLKIGALATHRAVAGSAVVREKFDFLAQAADKVGTPQIRSMGTVGGNICNSSPAADTPQALIALGARVKLVGPKGERIIPLEEFFKGPGACVLGPGELLAEIQVPNMPPRSGGAYLKLTPRSAIDIATVGVAAFITLSSAGNCSDARIVLGAVAPTPLRARQAETEIKGKKLDDSLIGRAAQLAQQLARPISDVRSSAEYRKEMVAVLTRRALAQALEKAKSASIK